MNTKTILSNYPEYDKHEFVLFLKDESSGLDAVIAIHSRVRGMAHGGTRVQKYDSPDGALRDALNLSRAMTFKSALANLPYGGAKGVISLPDGEYDKTQLLAAYAEKINALQGLFHTGTDVGLSDQDAVFLAQHCKYILGTKVNEEGFTTSKTAALGVFTAMQAAAQYKYGTSDLSARSVAVKGVGKLGGELVGLLHTAGAHVTIADTNPENVQNILNMYGDIQTIDCSEIATRKCDIYAPCALGAEFDDANVSRLACDIVCGGANNQLASDDIGDRLFEQGIQYVPDYIANAGGLIFICEELEHDGFNIERLHQRVQAISDTVTEVLHRSETEGIGTHRIADQIARERIKGVVRDNK